MDIVGHGPSREFGPVVPGFLIVCRNDGSLFVLTRDGESEHSAGSLSGKTKPCDPEPLRDGSWPMFYSADDVGKKARAEWFPLSEEGEWVARRARELLDSASGMRGDPELAIRTLEAAAFLVSLDIEKV